MTGDLSMLAPAMVAVGAAVLIVGKRSIYHSQLPSRADSPAHRFRFAMPVLATLPVRNAQRAPRCLIPERATAADAMARLLQAGVTSAPVVDVTGRFIGDIDLDRLRTAESPATVSGLADHDAPTLTPDDPLDSALETIVAARRSWVSVVLDGRVVGTVSVRDVITSYRAAVAGSVRQVRVLHDAGVLLEGEVTVGSPLAGRFVRDVAWPDETTLVSIERGRALVVPNGGARLEAGDRLTVLAAERSEPAARELLGGAAAGAA
jgi:CIC family chloride channel protein